MTGVVDTGRDGVWPRTVPHAHADGAYWVDPCPWGCMHVALVISLSFLSKFISRGEKKKVEAPP